jgi:hypothetical protein
MVSMAGFRWKLCHEFFSYVIFVAVLICPELRYHSQMYMHFLESRLHLNFM